jgi:predicted nucleic-acid-binding protein
MLGIGMRAVDTNVLVRLIVRDDARQAAAADAFVAGGAWVSLLALVETVWVLVSLYERTPAQVAATVEHLLDHDALSIQDAEVVRAALSQFREKPRLGFSDCLMLQIARKSGHTPLGTFDRGLGALEGTQRL